MARVHFVKKARKAQKEHGIKKGDSYYWWQFRFRAKCVSKTAPKRSQLTQSAFLGQLYDLEDRIAEFTCDNADDFQSFKEEVCSEIDDMKSTCEENLSNIPDQLQEGSAGQLLQERIDNLESWQSDIESIDCDYDEDSIREEKRTENEKEEGESEDDYNERIDNLVVEAIDEVVSESIEELQNTSSGC